MGKQTKKGKVNAGTGGIKRPRKATRKSPYQRDMIQFKKAQRSTKNLIPKSTLHTLACEVATSVRGFDVKVQKGVVEMLDSIVDQHLHSILFPAGSVVRASGSKRLYSRQLAGLSKFNKSSGKGPRWSNSSIEHIRKSIGLGHGA